jgi:hypothetical protein
VDNDEHVDDSALDAALHEIAISCNCAALTPCDNVEHGRTWVAAYVRADQIHHLYDDNWPQVVADVARAWNL